MAQRLPEPTTEIATPARKGITRRQALAAAVATGVGVGAVRLLGGTINNIARSGTTSGTDWVSPLARESARVAQLLRRTTFGYTPAQLEASLSDGYSRTVDHMLTTTTPFAERMTLFWHGHFTSDYRKTADNTFMYWQNLTWRRMALTSLGPMLTQVTTDPAMLRYLDLATSTGQSPNENYSRELMELFTMGAGNDTEEDVRQSATALAGWQIPPPDSTATVTVDKAKMVTRKLPVYSTQRPGVFNAR